MIWLMVPTFLSMSYIVWYVCTQLVWFIEEDEDDHGPGEPQGDPDPMDLPGDGAGPLDYELESMLAWNAATKASDARVLVPAIVPLEW